MSVETNEFSAWSGSKAIGIIALVIFWSVIAIGLFTFELGDPDGDQAAIQGIFFAAIIYVVLVGISIGFHSLVCYTLQIFGRLTFVSFSVVQILAFTIIALVITNAFQNGVFVKGFLTGMLYLTTCNFAVSFVYWFFGSRRSTSKT